MNEWKIDVDQDNWSVIIKVVSMNGVCLALSTEAIFILIFGDSLSLIEHLCAYSIWYLDNKRNTNTRVHSHAVNIYVE